MNFVCSLKTITQTKAKLDKYSYYGDSAPSISMVKKWFTEFRCGRTSTEDAERSGRPVEVSTAETIEKIHDMVLADRRLKVREIAEAMGISHGSVVSILNDHLLRESFPQDGCRVCSQSTTNAIV